ncbi:MAG: site-specific DNA-methyltransferase [Nitrosarchaeum sp.]|nr:site-specific DNA-methyltransferase [Nitrosarchaeum sp.]
MDSTLRMKANQIYNQNCIEGMNAMNAESVDLCITSPPYDDLRTYNDSSKWDFNVFQDVAQALTRVLKPGGVIMWNVGDSTINGSETGSSFRQALYFMESCGLKLHDTMIYEKTGSAYCSGPKSVRYTQIFEYCFILSKGKPKTINLIQDKPNKWAGITSWGNAKTRKKDGDMHDPGRKSNPIREFGVRTNIWRIKNSGGFGQSSKESYKHPATMPEELAQDHIITWSNPGDLVIDPFMGSGTTAAMAIQTERNYIGFEIDDEYYKLCQSRLTKLKTNLNDFFE